jgi:metallo-beta-lactamase family protein
MKLNFLGAAEEVTGSCYLVESSGARFLVDCGMFQGGREAYQKNLDALQFNLKDLDFVLLTHAHVDHSGLLPRLCALGFKGPIYTTDATADLLRVMLPDSAHIQEKAAEWEAQGSLNQRRHRDVAPLYTVVQAQEAIGQLRTVPYDLELSPAATVRCRFRDAGHILGSAIIEVWVSETGATRKLVFSGDLGQPGRPVLRDPTRIDTADVLLVESTYGNRLHKSMADTLDELVLAIQDTFKRKHGNVVVPAFAVGRTQEILYLLIDLVRNRRLENLHVYVDSPMATRATEITYKHLQLLDKETRSLLDWQKIHPGNPRIDFVEDVQESMALNQIEHGALIISASGMCDAGRIKHHLRHNLGRSESTVLITGFQARGTLGRRLVDGAKSVRIFNEEIPVRAQIYTIGGLSAHADQGALLDWLEGFKAPPRHTFIVHGEAEIASAFADKVRTQLNWADVRIPERGAVFSVD